jgi:heptosyltransferase-3
MNGALEQLPTGARFLILRLRSLGDCVLTTPAIRILKSGRPDLRIGVAVQTPYAPVFEGNPDIEELLEPATGPISRFRPHLCLNFHGGTRSMILAALSGARLRAGFSHHRGSWIYHLRVPAAQEILGVSRKVHTAEHLASAMFWLGAPRQEIPRAALFAEPEPAPRPYAVIHPFASRSDKTWPTERFLKVARHLQDHCGLDVVFIGGPGDDTSVFAGFRCARDAPLARIKSLLSAAALFIGNDSGPAHMAAAFGLPVVVLFGSSDPVVWAPWRTAGEVLTHERSIAQIATEQVLAAVERLGVKA